jgi:hypothetical protein
MTKQIDGFRNALKNECFRSNIDLWYLENVVVVVVVVVNLRPFSIDGYGIYKVHNNKCSRTDFM